MWIRSLWIWVADWAALWLGGVKMTSLDLSLSIFVLEVEQGHFLRTQRVGWACALLLERII